MSARWLRAANDVFMSALLFNAQTILNMRRICSVMGARAVVFATRTLVPITTLLVPITTFANLSDSCALAEDNGQTFRSDSFGNTYDNRDGTVCRTRHFWEYLLQLRWVR